MVEREPRPWPTSVRLALDVASGRHALSDLVPPLLWLFDGLLTCLVIWKIPYTEIDWVAYMEQISQIVAGERDYTKVAGGTGPLVYPAAHVYTFTGLYYLTNEGEDILMAQRIFAVLYMATLAVVMLCYRKAKVPPYVLPVLVLSKRLHSVFVLRCFNDCFAAFFLWLAIFFFQRRYWTFGAVAFSWGLGIKMSLLLALPAVGVLLFLGRGLGGSLRLLWLMAQVQIAIAVPFVARNAGGYLGRAFELSRQFKYEWTVNWRMLPEEVFLSRQFSLILLAGHAGVLILFLTTRWIIPAGRPLTALTLPLLRAKSPFSRQEEVAVASRVTPEFVMTTILSANVIGLLFARTLHYQFYAYLAWMTPYFVWRAIPNPVIVWGFWALQEYAWNVFPSTTHSSTIVVACLYLAVGGAYLAPWENESATRPAKGPARADESRKSR